MSDTVVKREETAEETISILLSTIARYGSVSQALRVMGLNREGKMTATEAQIADTIEKMLDILSTEEKWCQGADAKFQGSATSVWNPCAQQFCLRGAAVKALQGDIDPYVNTLSNPILFGTLHYLARCLRVDSRTEGSPFRRSVVDFNDSDDTTYEDVRLLLKTALHALQSS